MPYAVYHDRKPAHSSERLTDPQHKTDLTYCSRCEDWFLQLATPKKEWKTKRLSKAQVAHQHATRAEERICEAEQEAIVNGDAPDLRLEGELSPRECATVLHGLRMIQTEGRIEGCHVGDCEHFEDHEALSNAEIDTLAERINLGWINSTVKRMSGSDQSKTWTPNPDECVRLCEALAAFWGASCDAPIWPGAYITAEKTPIRDLIRTAVGWRKP